MGENFGDPVARMLKAFPELKAAYDNFATEDFTPGSHIVFGSGVFTSYVVALMESGLDEERLAKLFQFVEEMAESGDDDVVNVVAVTICEFLSGHRLLHTAWPLMGPVTSRIALEIAHGWGHSLPGQYDPYEVMIGTSTRSGTHR
jgi:hypothetical protein